MSLYSGSYSVHTINENLSVNCKSVHLSNPKQKVLPSTICKSNEKINYCVILFFHTHPVFCVNCLPNQ